MPRWLEFGCRVGFGLDNNAGYIPCLCTCRTDFMNPMTQIDQLPQSVICPLAFNFLLGSHILSCLRFHTVRLLECHSSA